MKKTSLNIGGGTTEIKVEEVSETEIVTAPEVVTETAPEVIEVTPEVTPEVAPEAPAEVSAEAPVETPVASPVSVQVTPEEEAPGYADYNHALAMAQQMGGKSKVLSIDHEGKVRYVIEIA